MKQKKLVAEIIAMQDILYRFASRLTSNENDAKDLLQETSYRALKGQNDYIEYGTIKSWLFTIMRNTFLNDQSRLLKLKDNIPAEELSIPFIDDQLESRIISSEILKIIYQLDREKRIPFLLYITGYSYDEIAEKLKIPLGTVKSRIHQARQILKDRLKELR